MSTPFQTESARNPDGIRSERVPDSALNKPASQVSTKSPTYGTRVEARDDREVRERDRQINYADALTAVVRHLRPDWDPADIRRQVLRDPRPDAIAAPAAIFAACDRDMRHPGSIGAYQPPTHKPQAPTEFPRAPRCPHGVLADPDGRGAGCEGCGTRAVPMPAGLAASLRGAS